MADWALIRFNDLRNTIAHGDPSTKIDTAFAKLCAAVNALAGTAVSPSRANVGGLAIGIGAALAVDTEESLASLMDRMGIDTVH